MTMAKIYASLPPGWTYEKADPSVGIFNEGWFHEDCNVVQGPGNGDLKGCTDPFNMQISKPDRHGIALFRTQVTCLDCGEVMLMESPGVALVEGDPDIP